MLTCRQATQLLSEQLDQTLSFRQITALRCHILICRSCRRYGRQVRSLKQLSKRYTQQTLPVDRSSRGFYQRMGSSLEPGVMA